MITIASIVEGHGEVAAAPVLVRRIAQRVAPGARISVPKPYRVQRQRFVKPGEVERIVEFVARRSGPEGRLLILLDANGDCPKDAADEIRRRAQAARADRRISVVLANMEYEAWFLAAIESIAGRRGIAKSVAPPRQPETVQDAKSWLSKQMAKGRSYSPSADQPALTASFDMDVARQNARSFDKLYREVKSLLCLTTPPSTGYASCAHVALDRPRPDSRHRLDEVNVAPRVCLRP